MPSKIPWIVAVVVGAGLLFSLIGLGSADKARKRAEAELAEAARAREEAAGKFERTAKAQKETEADLAKAKENLAVSLAQVKELEEHKQSLQKARAKLESYFTAQQLAEAEAAQSQPDPDDADLPAARPLQPGEWSVVPVLPPDTLFVVTVRDARQAVERFKQNGLWQIWSSPDVQRVFRAPLATARAGIVGAELMVGIQLNALLDFVSQGEITFAVLGLDKTTAQGQPLADLLISLQPRNSMDALMDEITKRLDQIAAAAGDKFVVTKFPQGNTIVNTITVTGPNLPGGQIRIQYARADGNVVAAFGEGRLERLLALHEKYKTELPKSADGQAPEVLNQVPAYSLALERAGPDAALVAYLNVAGLLKNPILNFKPQTAQQRLEWDALGLENIQAISYSASIRRKGIREATFIHMPLDKRKGVLGLLEGEGVGLEELAAAPRNSILALALKISPERLLDKIIDLAAMQNPGVKEDIATALAAIGQGLNMDLKKEVLGAFSGRVVFSVSVNGRNPRLPVSFPQPVLALGIRNPDSLKNLLRGVRDAMKDNWDITDVSAGEKDIVAAKERTAQGRDPGQFAYVVDKDELLVSLYPLALREELARRGAAARGASEKELKLSAVRNSLAANGGFDAARRKLKTVPQALLYVDTAALAVAAYDVLMPVAQLAPRNPQVDVTAVPTSDVLLQNLGATILGFSSDKDGVTAEGYSPAGAVSLLALAGAVAPARRVAQVQVRRQANKQQLEFEELGRRLKLYVQENGGKYPAALRDVLPKDRADLAAEVDAVEYRGKQDAGNKVVAYSSEKRPGLITVLTQDGTVTQIPRALLGKVLQEGVTANLAAQPPGRAADQKAVKPPRPPEF